MQKSIFDTQTFTVAGTSKIACLVLGFLAKTKNYKRAISDLQKEGYTVITYKYNPSVLTSGDPQGIIDLIEAIAADFSSKIDDYDEVICVGTSVGAGIGINLQQTIPKIHYGIYAVAGVSPSDNIYEAPIFFFVRKAFKKRGFDAAKLNELWHKYELKADRPPTTSSPFVIVLGRQDKIVKYKKALTTLTAWQAAGVPIKIITKRQYGHRGTISWFTKNVHYMLAEAKLLVGSTPTTPTKDA